MKNVKYMGAAVLAVIALSQVVQSLLVAFALMRGEGGNAAAYLVGELAGHLVVAILSGAFAARLFRRAGSNRH